jgi:hypothetical protein
MFSVYPWSLFSLKMLLVILISSRNCEPVVEDTPFVEIMLNTVIIYFMSFVKY